MSRADHDKQEACGYTPAKQRRDNCGGCKRSQATVRDADTPYERHDLVCKLH